MDLTAIWRPSRRTARVLDAMLMVVVVGVGWAGQIAARDQPDVQSGALSAPLAVLALVATLPLWWRRRWPLAMFGAFTAAVVVAGAVDGEGLFSGQIALCAAVLLFAIGAWSTRRRASIALIGVLLVLVVLGGLADGGNVVAALAFGVALVLLPAVAGEATRARRQYVAEVEQRLATAERERDERAHRAVLDERHRIARELHDVVAHHVSLIGVQAGAARASLDRSPERARAALGQIEVASRTAVAEMRQLLDVLAPLADGAAPPQPGLDLVPALVDRWRAAGTEVRAVLTGDPSSVAPTVSLCCYRVVEEALTNVSRHSAAGAVTVTVDIGRDVAVDVVDPGPPRATAASSGRGLVGMRERVALCHGTLDVGTRPDGSFRVRAVVPAIPPLPDAQQSSIASATPMPTRSGVEP